MIQFLSWLCVFWLSVISVMGCLSVIEGTCGKDRSVKYAFWSIFITVVFFSVTAKVLWTMFDPTVAAFSFGFVVVSSFIVGSYTAFQQWKRKKT